MNVEKILPDLGLEVGDIVDFMGARGTVLYIDPAHVNRISVVFKNILNTDEEKDYFLADGRLAPWHTIPSLKLIEKKKKPKKVVTLYRYTFKPDLNIYQTAWTNCENSRPSGNVLKTETKEIEIDEQ